MTETVYEADAEKIRRFRLRSHHLDRKYGEESILEAAGACGFQNSPPGAWETALHSRVPGCAREKMEAMLYEEKSLIQAWSFRGAPIVFPAEETGPFLEALVPSETEPWIYTRGMELAMDFLGTDGDHILPLLRRAAEKLDERTVVSKSELDRVLAEEMAPFLPEKIREKWKQPSLYGDPDRQTVGGAAVSFLLRPCSFEGRVVFGRREGNSPSFTSFRNWMGTFPAPDGRAGEKLVRKFLHCYGPAGPDLLAVWLGCSGAQARRLWKLAEKDMAGVKTGKRQRYILKEDLERLMKAPAPEREVLLLGTHDPYLDQRDREVIREETKLQRKLWRTTASPGAVIVRGRAAGIWNAVRRGNGMEISVCLWEDTGRMSEVEALAEDYAAFRGRELKDLRIGTEKYKG